MNTTYLRSCFVTSSVRNVVLCVVMLISCELAYSQAKIGGNPQSISSSALLELESSNRGFLPPRIALNSLTDVGTIPSPAKGLLVYNNGLGLLKEEGYYYWNGSQWSAISGFSSSSAGELRVGETRASVVAVDRNLFLPGSAGTFRTWMNGRELGNVQLVNYQLLSSVANPADFIVFDGLRMDVASGGYFGACCPSLKLVNTTNQSKMITVLSSGTGPAQYQLGRMVIAANAVCWVLDDNDGFQLTENQISEFLQSQVFVHDPVSGAVRYYLAVWSVAWVNDGNGRSRVIASFSITRHS